MTPENIQEMYSAIKADPDGDGELAPDHSCVSMGLLPHSQPASGAARDAESRIQLALSPEKQAGAKPSIALGDSQRRQF